MYSTIAPSLGESRGVPSPEAPRSSPQASTLSGSVERIVYFDDETGQCVLDLKDFETKEHILVSGRLPFVYPGQTVDAELTDLDPYNTGLRQAKNLIVSPPANERALRKFLKSEAFDEMGPHLAKVLAKAFPGNFLSILDENPGQILEVQGVGKKKQKQIIELWKDFNSFTEFKTFLFENSLPLDWARRVWASHGRDSLTYFSKNPYETVVRFSFPFDVVDIYALIEGFDRESFARIRSCLFDLLQNHYRQGHCAYPQSKLVDEALGQLEVKPELIEEALELEIVEDNMVSDFIGQAECIYLKEIWEQERNVAQKLLKFEERTVPWGLFNMPKSMEWAQTLLGMQLAPLQKQAIETALNSSLTIITGGPGTGKTTLIRSLVTILKTQSSNFVLCSPTGRAAQRLEEATGQKAQTIHRLLKYDGMTGTFGFNPARPLDVDLVLIDEVSMVDLSLMSHLLDALPPHCALILVGDVDQIPSVGAGNVLQSLIASERFNTVRLKEIFRTKVESAIRVNAHRINSGEMPHEVSGGSSDFHYIPAVSVDETKKVIAELVTNIIPNRYGIKDPSQLQILVPLNKGALGTQQLNVELKELFSASTPQRSISGFGQNYKVGDKIMVVKNDYKKGVFNGDIGFIQDIEPIGQYVDILFDDRKIRFDFEELSKIHLAYAISIHKSQGSEYRAVIVVISKEHLPMAQRHLIYTAVTRGKEQVFLVADPVALQTAVLSDENNRRWQKLTELLEKKPH